MQFTGAGNAWTVSNLDDGARSLEDYMYQC
jgi:hypothetical protein